MLNEIARLLGFGVMVVAIGCVALVIITGIQNLIDEIKLRIRGKSLKELLFEHSLQVNIVSWNGESFSIRLVDKRANVVDSRPCAKWKDVGKTISEMVHEYIHGGGDTDV